MRSPIKLNKWLTIHMAHATTVGASTELNNTQPGASISLTVGGRGGGHVAFLFLPHIEPDSLTNDCKARVSYHPDLVSLLVLLRQHTPDHPEQGQEQENYEADYLKKAPLLLTAKLIKYLRHIYQMLSPLV